MVKVKLIEKAQMYAFLILVAGFNTRWHLERTGKQWGVTVGNVRDLMVSGWVACVFFLYRKERMFLLWLLVDSYIKIYENRQECKNIGWVLSRGLESGTSCGLSAGCPNLTRYGQKELFLGENRHYLVVEFHLVGKNWGHLSWWSGKCEMWITQMTWADTLSEINGYLKKMLVYKLR